MAVKRPVCLSPGDTVGIAASASPFEQPAFESGVALLESFGLKVFFRPDIFNRNFYLAGSDQRRADELKELLANPGIKAILFARGGYGMLRVLPHLQPQNFSDPKIMLGYSDITPLLNYVVQEHQWPAFYGPVVAKDLALDAPSETITSLKDALLASHIPARFHWTKGRTLQGGQARGILVGGCLSLVVATLGTPYEIVTEDRILFLEDVNELPYAVDRMLTQLILAGKLRGVRGLLFGEFAKGAEAHHYETTLTEVLQLFKGPILTQVPVGHGRIKHTLPLGLEAILDADQQSCTYLEHACLAR